MNICSRRQFIQSCIYLSLSGFSAGLIPFCSGCNRKENASSLDLFNNKNESLSSHEKTEEINQGSEPSYVQLHKSGELKERGEMLWDIMKSCQLCPRKCGVDRIEGNEGFCQASSQLEISSYHPHFGEEKSLVGRNGSGTVFLTNCGLRCVFCINWEVSQGGAGKRKRIEDMAEMMLHLQKMGCHNINFVTPTHYSPHIVLAVDIAANKGLRLPLVYNTCGWERIEILKKLDGIVDIYLPDFKYSDGRMAGTYSSGAEFYPQVTQEALLEMHRQVGTAKPSGDGLMYRGLMIRHLVMPNGVSGTKGVIEWIAKNLPKDTYLNIMSQYRPVYKAFEYPEISRRITSQEYKEAVEWAKKAGLTNLDIQGYHAF